MLKIILKKYKASIKEQSSLARKLLSKEKKDFPHFSLSHKHLDDHAHILIVLSYNPVGADLELLIDKDRALLDFFKDDEYKNLGGKNWENFYILWTAKEAVIKLLESKEDLRQKIKLSVCSRNSNALPKSLQANTNMQKLCSLKTKIDNENIYTHVLRNCKYIMAIAQKNH